MIDRINYGFGNTHQEQAEWQAKRYQETLQNRNALNPQAYAPLPPIDGGTLVAETAPEPEEPKALPPPDEDKT